MSFDDSTRKRQLLELECFSIDSFLEQETVILGDLLSGRMPKESYE